MIYYETDQIDDLNLNYYCVSKIKIKYSKDEKDYLINLLSNNIKEEEDYESIKEFKTEEGQNLDYSDDSDLNKKNRLLLESKYKTELEENIIRKNRKKFY